jgi:uncharacterized membrane protein YphA (DoxX/SURF4 family)
MVFEATGAAEIFLVARIVFGGILAFMGLNHFMQTDMMTGYAEAKGLPAPRFGVIASGVMLVGGGLSIALGAYPVLGAGALAVFLLVSAVIFHNFWAVPEDQMQDEMTGFLKNVGLLGGALLFLAVGGTAWPYALDIGLF